MILKEADSLLITQKLESLSKNETLENQGEFLR